MDDQKEILNNFLNNESIFEMTELTKNEIQEITFGKSTNDALTSTLKRMIISYCNGDAHITIIKNANIEIEKFSRKD